MRRKRNGIEIKVNKRKWRLLGDCDMGVMRKEEILDEKEIEEDEENGRGRG